MKTKIVRQPTVLIHKQGEEREDHKYIKREWKNNKWVYYYEKETDDLFDSQKTYNVGKNTRVITERGKITRTYESIIEKGKSFADKILNQSVVNIAKDSVEKGKAFIDKLFKRSDEKTSKESDGEPTNEELIKRINDKSSQKVESEYVQKERRRKEQEEREKTEVLDDFSDLKVKHTALSNDEEQAAVNPYYYTKNLEYTTNCAYCTLTYDLRKRGYDVEAGMRNETEDGDTNFDTMAALYDGAELVSLQDVFDNQDPERHQNTIEKLLLLNIPIPIIDIRQKEAGAEKAAEYLTQELESYGDGARGMLGVTWSSGGAHAMVWEIEHGELVIRDCQSNKVHDVEDILALSSNFNYMRTDNVEPTTEILKYVRNKGDK